MRAWLDARFADQGAALKLLLVGALTLVLLIPLALVEDVVAERAERHAHVLREIADLQGGEQTLVGPVVVVPFVREVEKPRLSADGEPLPPLLVQVEDVAVILPESLSATAELVHEVRRRGVYEAPVYAAALTFEGAFRRPDLADAAPGFLEAHWEKAAVVLGVSDIAGLAEADGLVVDGARIPFEAGPPAYLEAALGAPDGRAGTFGTVHAAFAPAAAATGDAIAFSVRLRLNGSGGFFLAPAARQSRIALEGDWPHPSFQGAPAPAMRQVDDDGFDAEWRIPGLARGYADVATGPAATRLLAALARNAVGFRHVRPDDIYVAALRAAKYGVLLTALTFLACFVLERFSRERLHPAQYGLIGLSLALFYVLLTALAERIGLLPAYAAAAGAIVLMNGGYVAAALRSARQGLGAGAALACLYAAFYVMLASEDDALLIGAGLLLAGLALAMAATARINRRADAAGDGGAPQPVRG